MATTKGQHLIGQTIGSCVLERILGRGGTSTVYLAHSIAPTNEGEQVAVKVFLPRSTLDGQMRKSFYQRFLKEARAVSQLDHPHILSVYAYGEHEGMPYIVMPYMAGGTLSEYIQQHGPLSLPEALRYVEQIADALDYAHQHNCVHCDVKPANILLDIAGNAALSDFGTVRLLQAEEEVDTSSKAGKKGSSETLMGTPDYVSPEQALGEPLDGRTDVYSLGASLYALLTGDPPFQADTPIALTLMHVNEAPTPVGLFRADVTSQIDYVMSKALAKWPDERYQTAGSFAVAFREAVHEAEGKGKSAAGRAREEKRRTGEVAVLSSTATSSPGVVQKVVPVKPAGQRFAIWRTSLLTGLVVVLLVACLVTALFIRSINAGANIHQNASGHPTPTRETGPANIFADRINWPQSSMFLLQNGTYSIENALHPAAPAVVFYQDHNYGDFRIQVTALEINAVLNGGDYYGLAFRAPLDQSHYYLFEITAWEQGQYVFLRYDGGTNWSALASGSLSGFNVEANTPTTLSVEARENTFTLAINGKSIGQAIHDHSKKGLAVGEIGLSVEEQGAKVMFSHLYITEL